MIKVSDLLKAPIYRQFWANLLIAASWLIEELKPIFAPPPVEKMDQWLLRRWPLLWRSRLLWATWITLLLLTVGIAFGPWIPITGQEISTVHSFFQLAGLIAIVFLTYLQWCIPIGEVSQLKKLRLAFYSSFVVLILMLQPSSVLFSGTFQNRQILDWSETNYEYQQNLRYDFWTCSDQLPNKLTTSEAQALKIFLNRLDLSTNGVIHQADGFNRIKVEGSDQEKSICKSGERVLEIRDSSGRFKPALLEVKLKAIYTSHSMWNEFINTFVTGRLFLITYLAPWMLVVFLFWLAHQPIIRLRQLLTFSNRRFTPTGWSLPRPKWLVRQDQRLLRNKPVKWASRTHLFAYHGLLFGVAGSTLIVFLYVSLFKGNFVNAIAAAFGKGNVLFLLPFIALPALLPIIWAIARRGYPVIVSAPMNTASIVRHYLFVTLTIALIFVLVGLFSGMYDTKLWGQYIFLGVNSGAIILSVTFIGDTRGWRSAVTALMIYCTSMFGNFLLPIGSEGAVIVLQIITLSALYLWMRISESITSSTVLLATAPACFFWLMIAASEPEHLGIDRQWLACLMSMLVFPLYFYLLLPAIHHLVRAVYQPKLT